MKMKLYKPNFEDSIAAIQSTFVGYFDQFATPQSRHFWEYQIAYSDVWLVSEPLTPRMIGGIFHDGILANNWAECWLMFDPRMENTKGFKSFPFLQVVLEIRNACAAFHAENPNIHLITNTRTIWGEKLAKLTGFNTMLGFHRMPNGAVVKQYQWGSLNELSIKNDVFDVRCAEQTQNRGHTGRTSGGCQ